MAAAMMMTDFVTLTKLIVDPLLRAAE